MKKRLAIALVCLVATAGVVQAGLKGNYPVTITGSQAMGGLATARSSVNPNTHIGCYAQIYLTPNTTYWGYCQARDDAGLNAMCTSTNPDLVLQMARLQGDARLHIQWDPATYNCTSIAVQQSSMQAPKVP